MAKKSTRKLPAPVLLQDAALRIAGDGDWRRGSMADIADASGVPLDEALLIYPTKSAVMNGFMDRVDETMLRNAARPGPEESVRERLFDLIMARFDTLQPYREGVTGLLKSFSPDPCATACQVLRVRQSLILVLEASGISSNGISGQLRLKGLAVIYAVTVRAWLNDDSVDLGKTMAALDRGLARAEQAMCYLGARGGRAENVEASAKT